MGKSYPEEGIMKNELGGALLMLLGLVAIVLVFVGMS